MSLTLDWGVLVLTLMGMNGLICYNVLFPVNSCDVCGAFVLLDYYAARCSVCVCVCACWLLLCWLYLSLLYLCLICTCQPEYIGRHILYADDTFKNYAK